MSHRRTLPRRRQQLGSQRALGICPGCQLLLPLHADRLGWHLVDAPGGGKQRCPGSDGPPRWPGQASGPLSAKGS
jgi:hypothetical protein